MGEIAEDIATGLMCSWCGVCFVEEHGFPVICKDCNREKIIPQPGRNLSAKNNALCVLASRLPVATFPKIADED